MKKKTSRGAAAAGSRPAKIGELVRQELSSMFQDGWVRDPRFSRAFVTVTGVTMTQDLAYGTVHVSVYSEDKAIVEGVLESLRESARDLRRELGRRLTIRHTPDLRFSHDGSAAYGEKMERLLKDIRSSDTVREPNPVGQASEAVGEPDTDDRTDPDIKGVAVPSGEGDDDPNERTNPDGVAVGDAIEEAEDTPADPSTAPSLTRPAESPVDAPAPAPASSPAADAPAPAGEPASGADPAPAAPGSEARDPAGS